MEFLSQKSLHRRTFLRGLSATIALPYLDAMEPAGRFIAKVGGAGAVAKKTRLVCIESVHGAAGSNAWGASKYLWAPQGLGRDFTFNPEGAAGTVTIAPFDRHVDGYDGYGPVWESVADDLDAAMIGEFLAAVRTGRQPLIDGLAGLRTLRIVDAAQRSARSGDVVTV